MQCNIQSHSSFDFIRKILLSENSCDANKEEELSDSEQFSNEDSSNIISNSNLKIENILKIVNIFLN